MVEARPCPFCGCEDINIWGERIIGRVRKWAYCVECQAQGPSTISRPPEDVEETEARALEQWNERVPEPPEQESER